MSATRAAATFSALALMVSACTKSPASTTGESTAPMASAEATSAPQAPAASSAPARDKQLPVPESVAKIHQRAFEPTANLARLGKLLCLVTLHDAPLKRGEFYPLALFANGSVATWRQTPTGSEEPFTAKLSPAEQARASELLEAIPADRGTARDKFDASAMVMGVSTRAGERIDTLYFDNNRIPAAHGELVAMLKQRLEATNRAP